MNRAQKNILAILGTIICGLFAVIGWITYGNYQTYWTAPLGPGLNLPAASADASSTFSASLGPGAASTEVFSTPGAYVYLPTITPPPTFTPLAGNVIGGCSTVPVMTILAIGTDSRHDWYEYGLADVIRVVRVDFVHKKVILLEFPRDLWVRIPEISDNLNGQDHEKLNQAYLYGNPGFHYWDDPSAGPGLLARTLNLNFGVRPDHYIAVNMRTFEKIVNSMDGIDINVPGQGAVHLDGKQALAYARDREEGVFERADGQNRVLCALRDKLVSPTVLPRIPDIINSFTDNVQTDLSPEQISQLACLGTKMDPSLIIFASFPDELFTGTRIYDPVFDARLFIWNADFTVLRGYVTRFNEGSWPILGETTGEKDSTPFCPPPGQ
jgi:LCP family protein required for cell wall assembly